MKWHRFQFHRTTAIFVPSVSLSLLFLLIATAHPCPGQQLSSQTVTRNSGDEKPDRTTFTTIITVATKARYVKGLHPDDFRIEVNKRPAEVLSARNVDEPLSIGVLFDLSGSMGGGDNRGIKRVQQAVKSLE